MTLAGFADGLAALVESLRLEPAHVAGVTWGGTIALELYRRHPALVATLIATQHNEPAGFLSGTEYSGSFDALASVSSDIDADDLAEATDHAGSSTSAEPSSPCPTARPLVRQDFRAPAEGASKQPSH